MILSQPVTAIKGVGDVFAAKLAALGVTTVEDLIYFFPRRYEDFSQVTPITRLRPGNATIKGQVESVTGRYIRRGLHITEAVIGDGTGKTRAVWFNQTYRAAQLAKGKEYFFSGVYGLQRNRYIVQNPSAELAESFGVSTARIVPIYRLAAGVKSHHIRKIMKEALSIMKMLPETLPPDIIRHETLLGINRTLTSLHFPENTDELEAAKARISFEEVLALMLASALNKRDIQSLQSWRIPFDAAAAKRFTAALPFALTDAQRRAAWEIVQDISREQPMNRLLQGDVGSGKTAVSAMAVFMAAKAGYQTAFLAPTEILAAQHARHLADLLGPADVTVSLLTGSSKPAAKNELKARMASGDAQVIVGTHALIQKNNSFRSLGLVVIDEQHRFGVNQRAELLKHGERMPHVLSMTATPIPRSLQLTVYGELEVSIINELPRGRQPIRTSVVPPQARYTVYEALEKELRAGRQAYVVCPRVTQGGPDAELKSVEVEYDRLMKSVFKHRRIGMLHGQRKAHEKEEVMGLFKAGALDILICTTVVEVGVDVPNASVMIIEGAERFGLAQLHQLRGRVGRGSTQSYCYLIPTTAQAVSQRLRELEQSADGFYLAEADLRLRGPGEIYGRAQHGELDVSFANLADVSLLRRARNTAQYLADTQIDLLQYTQLHQRVAKYRRLTKLN